MQRVMSISNSLGRFFDFGPFVIAGDFSGDDFDGFGRADEFAELAGDASFAVLFVGDEGGGHRGSIRGGVRPIFVRDTAW